MNVYVYRTRSCSPPLSTYTQPSSPTTTSYRGSPTSQATKAAAPALPDRSTRNTASPRRSRPLRGFILYACPLPTFAGSSCASHWLDDVARARCLSSLGSELCSHPRLISCCSGSKLGKGIYLFAWSGSPTRPAWPRSLGPRARWGAALGWLTGRTKSVSRNVPNCANLSATERHRERRIARKHGV